MMSTPSGTPLYGDWRRRRGSKTDAHLYDLKRDPVGYAAMPLCLRRVPYGITGPVQRGRPCSDCLVTAIRAAPDAVESGGDR